MNIKFKLIMLKFISLINLLFMYNYLFLNDEFAIMVCLLIVFSFFLKKKKYTGGMFRTTPITSISSNKPNVNVAVLVATFILSILIRSY